jgi:hypothetical protein
MKRLNAAHLFSSIAILFQHSPPNTSMDFSQLATSSDLPSWQNSGSCLRNHLWTAFVTSSLFWNVAKIGEMRRCALGIMQEDNDTSER